MSVRKKLGRSIWAFARRGKIRGSRGERESQRRGELMRVEEVEKVMGTGRKSWGRRRDAGAGGWKHCHFLKLIECHTDDGPGSRNDLCSLAWIHDDFHVQVRVQVGTHSFLIQCLVLEIYI